MTEESNSPYTIDAFIKHVDNVVLPQNLNPNSGFAGEVSMMLGMIKGVTKLDTKTPEGRTAIGNIYADARRAVLETIQESGEKCPAFKKWSHQEEGDYKPQIQNWVGMSVGQFAIKHRDRLVEERTKSTAVRTAG